MSVNVYCSSHTRSTGLDVLTIARSRRTHHDPVRPSPTRVGDYLNGTSGCPGLRPKQMSFTGKGQRKKSPGVSDSTNQNFYYRLFYTNPLTKVTPSNFKYKY